MKRVLSKVILPALAIGLWVLICYPVCNKAEGFDFFLSWMLAGFPFGIRKMCMILIPMWLPIRHGVISLGVTLKRANMAFKSSRHVNIRLR